MATTSDNSSPPSTPSESIQSKDVQLHDNGVLAGTAVANPNGAWQMTLNNLSEGSHIMTASSDGTVSNDWVVNVQARSGSENFENFPVQRLEDKHVYIGKSGLIICIMKATSNVTAEILNVNQRKALVLTYSGEQPSTLEFVLPTEANRVTFGAAKTFTAWMKDLTFLLKPTFR